MPGNGPPMPSRLLLFLFVEHLLVHREDVIRDLDRLTTPLLRQSFGQRTRAPLPRESCSNAPSAIIPRLTGTSVSFDVRDSSSGERRGRTSRSVGSLQSKPGKPLD